MTNKVKIAANHFFARLPEYQQLVPQHKENLLRAYFPRGRGKSCGCHEKDPKVIKIPVIFPIFPSTGEASHGIYRVLPFAYLAWKIPSQALPYVEVIEVPMFYKELLNKEKTQEEMDKSLLPSGKTIIGSFKKITPDNLHREILQIRQRILRKILDISECDSHIYLSIFSEMPKILVEEGFSRYFEAKLKLLDEVSWEYQSQRCVPIKLHQKLLVFYLDCWVITKKDLNIL